MEKHWLTDKEKPRRDLHRDGVERGRKEGHRNSFGLTQRGVDSAWRGLGTRRREGELMSTV